MSNTADKRFITCDGEGCESAVALPVGLRAALDPAQGDKAGAIADWLFVKTRGGWQHFCPRCAHQYIASLYGLDGRRAGETRDGPYRCADGLAEGEDSQGRE